VLAFAVAFEISQHGGEGNKYSFRYFVGGQTSPRLPL
jgi:hypothetical protein